MMPMLTAVLSHDAAQQLEQFVCPIYSTHNHVVGAF